MRIGKWPEAAAIVRDLESIIIDHDFLPMPVSMEHGRLAGLFANSHKDPFDRMLAAQSQVEAMPLVTADRRLKAFGINTIW